MVEGHSQKTQVKVCDICGDRGFSNALLYCSVCPSTAAHQYCLGITPGSIDDGFSWECEYCCIPTKSQLCTSMKPGGASTKRSEETCTEDMKEVKFKMRNINSLYPKSFIHKGKRTKRNPRREQSGSDCKRNKVIMRKDCYTNTKANVEAEAVTRQSGGLVAEVTRCLDDILKIKEENRRQLESSNLDEPKMDCYQSYEEGCGHSADERPNDQDNMEILPMEEQPEPLLVLLPIEYQGSSEHAETSYEGHFLDCEEESEEPISSLMECPEEIMRDLVLLVSPSGEIHVEPMNLFC